MKTFKDLVPVPKDTNKEWAERVKFMKSKGDLYESDDYKRGYQAKLDFPNGYGISVISGRGAYGDKDGPYECAVFNEGHLCYCTEITGDVIGYCNEDKVSEIMQQIQQLKKEN